MSGGASVEENTGNQGQMASALSSGLNVVDLNQTVTFTQYRRVVLPTDGFVFWVKADVLSPSALPNTSAVNSFYANRPRLVSLPAPTITAEGSLHHTTVNSQNLDESYATNRMVFTSKDAINDLNDIAPDTMYLATVAGQRFAFSSRNMWYKQAALYHYTGDAVYPSLASQIIENPSELDQTNIVVSNSLPIWLILNQLFPVFPSYLVPDNLQPPYAVAHISEDGTSPLQATPIYDQQGGRWQLVKDTVHITTYGVRNSYVMDWIDSVQRYALENPDVIGIMNSPIPRDAKRWQVEISALAQKKVITFEVNYYQLRMRDLARQVIQSAFINTVRNPEPLVETPVNVYAEEY